MPCAAQSAARNAERSVAHSTQSVERGMATWKLAFESIRGESKKEDRLGGVCPELKLEC